MGDTVSDKSLSDLITGGKPAPKPKLKMSDLRAEYPMYADLSDEEFVRGFRKKFYADLPLAQVVDRIDFDTERQRLQKEMLDEMGWAGQFAAGAGKSVTDIGRSLRRLNPWDSYSKADAEADAELDKPLEQTSGGFWGGLAGDVGSTLVVPGGAFKLGGKIATKALPKAAQAAIAKGTEATGKALTSALPKSVQAVGKVASPYAKQAASGAVIGTLTSPEDLEQGAKTGAIFGAVGEGLGRVATAGYQGAKSLIEPLWREGRERVLKRTLERYMHDPAAARKAMAAPEIHVPGTQPTLAEATMDPGLIQLQRGAQSTSPEVATALHEAGVQRLNAYRNVLNEMAGTSGRRAAAEEARRTAGNQVYEEAFAIPVQLENAAPEIAERAEALLGRPSIQDAMPAARKAIAEMGQAFDETTSIRGLHEIKKALDDQISDLYKREQYAGNVENTRDKLLQLMDDLSGGKYGVAREQYTELSRPVNQMRVADYLSKEAFPALGEYNKNLLRSRAESYARALRDEGTVRRATGMDIPLRRAMEPQQLAQAEGIAKDMARHAAVQEVARIPGSPTAQNMAAQNVLRGFFGPLGLPEGVLDKQVGKIMSGVLGFPYKLGAEQHMQQMLAEALRNPQTALQLLNAPDKRTVIELLQPYAARAAVQLGIQK